MGDEGARQCGCGCGTSSTSTTRRTPPRSRTSSRAGSTSATTSSPGVDKLIRGQHPDLLREGAVHARGQHGVARPEHDEEAAQRPQLPAGRSRPRSTSTGSSGTTTATSSRRRTRPGSCRSGTSGSTRRRSRRLGFRYSTARAKQILAANGYRDTNSDGFVENKDGSAARPPADRAERVVGLDDRDPDDRRQREGRRHPDHARPTRTSTPSSRSATPAKFELVINNEVQLAQHARTSTTTTCSACRSRTTQTTRNFQRYQNQRAWNLTTR